MSNSIPIITNRNNRQIFNSLIFVSLVLLLISTDLQAVEAQSPQLSLDNPRRDVEHFLRDETRKPDQVFEFLGIEPGMHVLDIYAADGYYSYVLSQAVGASGIVYAQNPATGSDIEDIRQVYSLAEKLDETIQRVPLSNVRHIREGFFNLGVAEESLDAIMLVQILHDFHNDNSAFAAALLNHLKTLLKPGGFIAVIDHAGDSGQDNRRLHRMEKQQVIDLALEAGLKPGEESAILSNPRDRRRRPVFDPMLARNTDRFLLKLHK
jgi:predicted methyltransferase